MPQRESDQYKIRPRKSRDGYDLESDRLSHGCLWYRNESDAISYAKWKSRVNGGKIVILDEKDQLVRMEEFSSGDFAY